MRGPLFGSLEKGNRREAIVFLVGVLYLWRQTPLETFFQGDLALPGGSYVFYAGDFSKWTV